MIIALTLANALATVLLVLGVLAMRRADHRAREDDRARIADLEGDYAAVPTEVRAMRAGERAADLEARGKLHDLRNRMVGLEHVLAERGDRVSRLEGASSADDLDPGDTIG